MRSYLLFLLFSALFLSSKLRRARCEAEGLASSPPRGWNSYDSFSWIVDEEAFLQNAEIVANKLKPYGYEYVVVDYLWYRKNVAGASIGYDHIDEWGRVIPDPDRWPSSRGGEGFKEVARKVHDMGLKFGIHVMRGISAQAVNAATPILDVFKGGAYEAAGQKWSAGDIGMKDMTCAWLKGFMSVNTDTGAGRAFLRSLYRQYAEWGVDFVKLDCVFGDDLDTREIITVSRLLKEIDRPILFSLSPGTSVTPSMAKGLSNYVNMYRITGDDWDNWQDVASHFNVARDFAAAKMIGAMGLHGRSWPDLDMLPLGWLTDPGVQQGPHRRCNLTLDEQRTQMTLWSMAKSPLMFGGDLRNMDKFTYSLITNPTLLEINAYSSNNMEFPHIFAKNNHRSQKLAFTQKFKSPGQGKASDNKVLEVTSCSNGKAKGWFTARERDMDQICWKHEMENDSNGSYCLYKRSPLLMSDEVMYEQKYQGKFQLLPKGTMDFCLEASANRKRSASERQGVSFSVCKLKSHQMWGLNDDGTLVNSFSNLCATVGLLQAKDNISGVRSWIATGRQGEIYLSFFNLNPKRAQISAKIGDLAKVLNSSFVSTGSCNCSEVWSGKNYGVVKQTLSAMVGTHGCRLFVLDCKS